MPTNRSQNGLDDCTNIALLEELQADARLSNAELGRRVGLSAPAVAERLARLEEAGVISGYRPSSTRARSATRSAWSCGSGRRRAS